MCTACCCCRYYKGEAAQGAALKASNRGIWKWNGGEGSRLQSECKAMMHRGEPPASKPHIQKVLLARKGEWGGIKWIEFGSDGSLKTPWGQGKWGDASTPKKPTAVFAEFIGQIHILTFDAKGAFESVRCADGEVVKGSLAQPDAS